MNGWKVPHVSWVDLGSVKEERPVALITIPSVWQEVSAALKIPTVVQAEPPSRERQYIDYLGSTLPTAVGVIYAVGDELVSDVAKMVAQYTGKPLVLVPTMLTSDHLFTAESCIDDPDVHHSQFVETRAADEVILDLELIRKAPDYQRAGAIVDVFSIVTGLLDWRYAADKNMTGPEAAFVAWIAGLDAALAAQAIKIASAVGKGDPEALKTLVHLLALLVQIDVQVGHRRASRGIEHIFCEALISIDPTITHSEEVGPGILLASALHKKDLGGLRAAMQAAGIRLNQLKGYEIRNTFTTLPDYAREHNAPYTILNELQSGAADLNEAIEKSALLSE